MDPTQCLRGILEMLEAGSHVGFSTSASQGLNPEECQELLGDLEALGDWIKNGGFLPSQWRK